MPQPEKKKKKDLRVELPMVLTKDVIKALMPAGREPATSIVEPLPEQPTPVLPFEGGRNSPSENV